MCRLYIHTRYLFYPSPLTDLQFGLGHQCAQQKHFPSLPDSLGGLWHSSLANEISASILSNSGKAFPFLIKRDRHLPFPLHLAQNTRCDGWSCIAILQPQRKKSKLINPTNDGAAKSENNYLLPNFLL